MNSNLDIVLESVYYLFRNGDCDAAINLLDESKKEIQSSPIHEKLSRLIVLIGKYEQNQLTAQDLSLLTPDLKSEIVFYQAWFHFLKGYCSKNLSELKIAANLFLEAPSVIELYEVYYWISNFRLLPNEEKYGTFLRTYPVQSVYSKINGNNFYKEHLTAITQIQISQAQTWLLDEDGEETFDAWLISGNTITPAKYSEINLGDDSFLDIYSGLINDRGEFLFLMISELNCLSFLISSQLIGASLSTIAAFLEKEEEDAAAILESLKHLGIKLNKKSNLYFLDWEAKPKIIIPRTLKVIGLQEYVKKKIKELTVESLAEVLQVTPFGAESLIKKWSLEGYIKPKEKKPNIMLWKFDK